MHSAILIIFALSLLSLLSGATALPTVGNNGPEAEELIHVLLSQNELNTLDRCDQSKCGAPFCCHADADDAGVEGVDGKTLFPALVTMPEILSIDRCNPLRRCGAPFCC